MDPFWSSNIAVNNQSFAKRLTGTVVYDPNQYAFPTSLPKARQTREARTQTQQASSDKRWDQSMKQHRE